MNGKRPTDCRRSAVRAEHFTPAFDVALRQHIAEVEHIAASPQAPSFDNTVAAFDASGRVLARISHLFHNLCSSETSPELQAVERTMAPRLAAHQNAIYLNGGAVRPRRFAARAA